MRPRWLVPISLSGHAVVVLAIYVFGVWHLERLEAAKLPFDLAVAGDPPPAPAGGADLSREVKLDPKTKRVTTDVTQHPDQPPETPTTTTTDQPGTGDGSGSGSGSGSGKPTDTGTCTDGPCGETPTPEPPKPLPPPPPPPIKVVPVSELKRVAGETHIEPPDVDKTAMQRAGTDRVAVPVKVCVSATGTITSASILHPSGYPAYDRRVLDGIATWRYQPYTVGGRAIPVCTGVTFIYAMK